MRTALLLALACAAIAASATASYADWRDAIAGSPTILPTHFEENTNALTVHASPRHGRDEPGADGPNGGASTSRWSLPLVDRRLDTGARTAPLADELLDTIRRAEPIFDATRLDGPDDAVLLRIFPGTAETRDLFGDHWRLASADPNVDTDVRPFAMAWTAGESARPCAAYRVRRRHDWGEAALSAPTAADCRAIEARQALGFADTAPLPVAIAAPRIPIFAAPEPGSRMSSADFWAAQRTRITSIQAHLHRKWLRSARSSPGAAAN